MLAGALLRVSAAGAAEHRERVVESILPALAYGPHCWSTIELQNLGDRAVFVTVEGHRSTGALVPLVGHAGMMFHLAPGESGSYKLALEEETTGAWVKVKETVPLPEQSPVIAVRGLSECVVDDQLRTTLRELAYPTRNPWFSGEVAGLPGDMIYLINSSEHAATASVCYSAGGLYSVPNGSRPAQLSPICSSAFDVQVPPFGTRQIPVESDGNTHFSVKTRGESIVLQMLRPVAAGVRMYSVDSTVKFGEEVTK
jgi:hypothetical protein